MFLFKNDFTATTTTIRGVRYITISFYEGDKDIFQKIGGLISQSFQSDEIDEITNESLLDSGIAFDEE